VTGPTPDVPLGALAARSAIGGVLMGLANLVPGISGGTMLLAAGVYPRFIQGIAEVTTLRFRAPALVVLGGVGVSAGAAIVLFAGTVKDLVVDHRWVMYSLFIGLTLGGLPLVKRLLGPMDVRAWIGGVLGFVGMAALALAQAQGVSTPGGSEAGFFMFLLAGVAGASAMILPGVSGGYLLLVLDMYLPILSGIDAFKEALKGGDVAGLVDPAVGVVLPVGIGVVVGIAGVSNLLKFFLDRFEKLTLGVLLGLLLGAVVGLWPFQHGVEPLAGDVVKGRVMTAETLLLLDREDWPTEVFAPTGVQVGGSMALVLLGLGLTMGVARFGATE